MQLGEVMLFAFASWSMLEGYSIVLTSKSWEVLDTSRGRYGALNFCFFLYRKEKQMYIVFVCFQPNIYSLGNYV